MGKVSTSIIMEAPVDDVFMYYARPEHVAGHFPKESKMKVIPIKITEGWGVGTVMRIIGEFGGRTMQWDSITCQVTKNKKIVSKALNGPFKKNVITVNFEEINDTTKVTFEADYILPNFIIGIIIDRMHVRKQVINGMDSSLQEVKKSVEEKHKETVKEEITVESKN